MFSCFRFCLASLFFVSATSAQAIDFFEQRGGWDIVGTESACAMTMSYEGPGSTELYLLMDEDVSHSLSLTNYNWSAKKNELYALTFQIDNTSTDTVNVAGIKVGYRPGFMALAEDKFVDELAKGDTLYVYLGEQLVDKLSLKGTAVAIRSLRRCRSLLLAEIAARKKEEERWAHLSGDPFSTARPALPNGPTNPEPRNSPGYWVGSTDYPSAAIREQRQGKVGFQVEVSAMGRVTLCRITATSGHADLDEAACRAITRRARFKPATNEKGQRIDGKYSGTINWKLPEPEPEPPEPVYIPAQ